MAYLVSITKRAERDLASHYEEIDARNSAMAEKWYVGLKEAVLRLADFPERCPVTPENPRLGNLLYGRKPHVYRVIYRVVAEENRVEVLHIRHSARRRLPSSNRA